MILILAQKFYFFNFAKKKVANENIRINNKENLAFEDVHKRLCAIEKDRDQALARLEAREPELKKLQNQ